MYELNKSKKILQKFDLHFININVIIYMKFCGQVPRKEEKHDENERRKSALVICVTHNHIVTHSE